MVRSYHKLLTLQPKYLTAEELLNKSGPNPRIKYCVFSENGVSKHCGHRYSSPYISMSIRAPRKINWKGNQARILKGLFGGW